MAPWRASAMKRGCRSSVALPLVCDATILGALNIYSSEENAFDLDELKLLEELASDIAYGILSLRTRSAHEEAPPFGVERVRVLSQTNQLEAVIQGGPC